MDIKFVTKNGVQIMLDELADGTFWVHPDGDDWKNDEAFRDLIADDQVLVDSYQRYKGLTLMEALFRLGVHTVDLTPLIRWNT